jgi:hypothetical protein
LFDVVGVWVLTRLGREYLTGFRKRKDQRRKEAIELQDKAVKEAKREQRREVCFLCVDVVRGYHANRTLFFLNISHLPAQKKQRLEEKYSSLPPLPLLSAERGGKIAVLMLQPDARVFTCVVSCPALQTQAAPPRI